MNGWLSTVCGILVIFGLGMVAREAVVRLQASSANADSAAAQASIATSGGGINAESGSRLPIVQRDSLDQLGKTMYDKIAEDAKSGRSIAGFKGPYGIYLYSPRVADSDIRKNDYLRFESPIGRRFYEVAVLITARELNHQFEWTSHEPTALKAGVDQSVIDMIKYRRPLTGLQPKDAAIIQLGRELFAWRPVKESTFTDALRLFGPKDLVDIVSVMGTYTSIGILLNAFDQQLAPGQKAMLPAN